MGSDMVWPKVIPLSGAYCIPFMWSICRQILLSFQNVPRWKIISAIVSHVSESYFLVRIGRLSDGFILNAFNRKKAAVRNPFFSYFIEKLNLIFFKISFSVLSIKDQYNNEGWGGGEDKSGPSLQTFHEICQ
jgi:hypothetical protein